MSPHEIDSMRGTTVAVVDAGAVSERTSAESGETVRQSTVDRILGAFDRNGVQTVCCGAQRKC